MKKITVTEQIIEELSTKIINNELKAGQKLPTERVLAEQYGVGRGSIREALRSLCAVGLIDIKLTKGSFVKEKTEWVNSNAINWLFRPLDISFDELFAVRKVLETLSLSTAYDLCNNLDLMDLEKIINELEDASSLKVFEYANILDRFDLKIAEITRNPLLIRLFQILIYLRRPTIEKILNVDGAIEHSVALRVNIYNTFYNKEKEKALEAIHMFFEESVAFYKT